MTVRRATTADLDGLTVLFDGYRQFYRQPSDASAARHFLAERLEQGESVVFVADDGEALVGFTQLYPAFSSVSLVRLWILNDLFVAASARQVGGGRQLMEAARAFAESTGAGRLVLTTQEDNRTAQRLYEALGYRHESDLRTLRARPPVSTVRLPEWGTAAASVPNDSLTCSRRL